MSSTFLVFLALVLPLASALPLLEGAFEPMKVGVPEKGDGKCLTLNGVEIKSGEWKAIDDCKLNCTCSKSGDSEYLNCDNWCEIERTVCNEGDAMSKTEYFEEVGTSGCKRCITKACDAIIPGNHASLQGKNSTSFNATHRTDGKFEIIEETIMIFQKPKKDTDA